MNKIFKIVIVLSFFVFAAILVSAGTYYWPLYHSTVIFDSDSTWILNDRLTFKGTLKFIGDNNFTGTLQTAAFESNTPHSFINTDDFGELTRTELCMIADNESVVLAYLGIDRGDFIWVFEQDSLKCLNKQIIEINSTTNAIITRNLFTR